tara:strand:- start:774 stop:1037 length:264 start_codon:yes stop_codon:yes gene_type:complete
MSDYNGYTNRETWLVNLHFGDYFNDIATDGQYRSADGSASLFFIQEIESTLWDMLEEANIPDIFKDMIDLGAVNWRELAELYVSEAA